MSEDWLSRAEEICLRCGGHCCVDAHPPVSRSCSQRLTAAGVSADHFEEAGYKRLKTRENGMCILSKDGRCVIHMIKPETCRAGPFTFDVKDEVIEIYLKLPGICPLVTLLKATPGAYQVQYDLAVKSIANLVSNLTRDELDAICRIEEPETEKVAEIPGRIGDSMTIGTEHEYSINDSRFNALPISDRIIKTICGCTESEILFGDVKLGKELQKTVLEIVPRVPADDLASLEVQLMNGIRKFHHIFRERYRLLGLGMHPTMTLDRTAVWDHDEAEYYDAYHRLFNIHQHGWLNIQALQINLSYAHEQELVATYNRLRSLLPYLIAVTASSPMVEGQLTGIADNRLIYYRENQKEIPLICNRIVPEKIRSLGDYRANQEEIFAELRQHGADILCEEWVNSSGLIVRFSRTCLEIKALDEQECIRSDMAVCAFVRSLLRCPVLSLESDQSELLDLTDHAIQNGTKDLLPELNHLYDDAWKHATDDERRYFPVIGQRIEQGSLAECICRRYKEEQVILPILSDMAMCLKMNTPYWLSPKDTRH